MCDTYMILDNFLRDVFQFIEDVVLIRISYSLATGHKKLTNKLMHVGIVGAFLTGLAAAIIGTILGAFIYYVCLLCLHDTSKI